MANEQSALLLRRQLQELKKHPVEGFSAGLQGDDIYKWSIMIMGPPDTLYEGGIFRAIMQFPVTYPMEPPTLTFKSEMWHPNVYPTGEVCISILHPPGEDKWGYEQASERWLPVHTVETILISVISMLSSPNFESPANIEAAKQLRDNYSGFKKKVQRIVEASQEYEDSDED
ncbi:ubiquitin-conjugating enzyme/RWD-like protein [Thamnocephalis sphaerospora]|uniref:E2 ubiquitin-conjugating enzyme n=1 Tax=Thamnocephalis sphaerospora TaxID=78915 RepID=A0A4P9XPR3_9FUNG|nr:ubiquitin-conjugating enzyme/RWD-like protein [Thamnocephalis sphaerospora]|eukprot:RKP08004.1 ubiquitin-conjugating enzyme/RWD-like protein [Thamnocephalis sphaerospora]